MFIRFFAALAPLLLMAISGGCVPWATDISNTTEVTQSKVLGLSLQTKRDRYIVEFGPPFRRKVLVGKAVANAQQKELSATIPAGTILCVTKVMRGPASSDGLFAIYSVFYFATVESGDLAGKVIGLEFGPEQLGNFVISREELAAAFYAAESRSVENAQWKSGV